MEKNINLKANTETYRLLKMRAAELGTTIKEAINEAFILWLEHTRK